MQSSNGWLNLLTADEPMIDTSLFVSLSPHKPIRHSPRKPVQPWVGRFFHGAVGIRGRLFATFKDGFSSWPATTDQNSIFPSQRVP